MSRETEQIKERLSIAEVVGEYVKLKQAGQSLKGLCPFHSEKTPSFIVTPARGSWHCFGCSEGGDVFSFIEKIEGIDFPAALKLLAERAGVELPDRRPEVENHRQKLLTLLVDASRFYHEILMNQKAGKRAKEYLIGRGVTEKTMEEFMIGYAPHGWDTLSKWLHKKGYADQDIVASGMAGVKDRGGTFDRFRGRIMFPVSDLQGRVVAFGGRIVPWHETGNEGKYVNSPETALYEKRRTVYNLSRAKRRIKASKGCIVVEGYMDVVMLVQAGIEHVVATSGTALTEEHVSLISRFTNTLHLAFDGDVAGWKATIAATQAALAGGMHVDTILFPDGVDPADLVKDAPGNVESVFSNTRPLMEVLIEQLGTSSSGNKEQALAAIVPLLQLVRNPIEQGTMIEQVGRLLRVPERQVLDLLSQVPVTPSFSTPIPPSAPILSESKDIQAERQLLGMLLAYPHVRTAVDIQREWFLDPVCREVYTELQRTPVSSRVEDGKYQSLLVAIQARAEELSATSSNSPEEEVRTMVRALHKRYLRSKLHTLAQEGSPGALVEFQQILTQVAEIDR
jgi:DNA primase